MIFKKDNNLAYWLSFSDLNYYIFSFWKRCLFIFVSKPVNLETGRCFPKFPGTCCFAQNHIAVCAMTWFHSVNGSTYSAASCDSLAAWRLHLHSILNVRRMSKMACWNCSKWGFNSIQTFCDVIRRCSEWSHRSLIEWHR